MGFIGKVQVWNLHLLDETYRLEKNSEQLGAILAKSSYDWKCSELPGEVPEFGRNPNKSSECASSHVLFRKTIGDANKNRGLVDIPLKPSFPIVFRSGRALSGIPRFVRSSTRQTLPVAKKPRVARSDISRVGV